MRRVLVTGATGLIGWPTMPHFTALGFSVVGMARHGAAGCLTGDLFDQDRMRAVLADVRPTHILHLAWDVTPGEFVTAPINLDYVGATLAFARAAAAAGIERFVGIGTCAEYDWRDGGATLRRETDPTVPDSIYGLAKDATHRLLAAFFRSQTISFAWARPFHMFGRGESPKRLVGGAVDAFRHGKPFRCRHGQLVRDFMATQDLGAALARLVASDVEGPVNIGSGEAVRLGDLIAMIADMLGRPALAEVHEEPAPGQPLAMCPELSRLRDAVGFVPSASLRGHLEGLLMSKQELER